MYTLIALGNKWSLGQVNNEIANEPLEKEVLLLFNLTDFPEMFLISNTSKSFIRQTCGQGVNNTLHHFIT